MRCDVFQSEESSSLKLGDQTVITDIEVWGDSFGQNSALAKANVAYLSLLPLRYVIHSHCFCRQIATIYEFFLF